ncbi:hypothetical protein SFRURICE_009430 [Spodoptera frugiperda]|nr:hypothetical protein SFRURICE_009430 [Spodoptera frugiperda]
MDLTASLLTFTMFWKLSWSLQCYTCNPEQASLPCLQFDYSSKYLTECEHSTMCFKKVTTLEFSQGLTSESITRGCASQTANGEQRRINGKWRAVQDIHEVYEETCSEDPSNSERSPKTMYCYCRGDRCNGSQQVLGNLLAFTAIIILGVLS